MTSGDALLAALKQLAEASFPQIFDPAQALKVAGLPSRGFFPALLVPACHPASAAAKDALAGDPDLRGFHEAGDTGVFVTSSLGTGWRLTAEQLVPSIIGSAANRVLADSDSVPGPEELVVAAEEVLGEFRRLVRGEEVPATTLVAFEGFAVGSARIELPWGVLRAAREFECRIPTFATDDPTAVLVLRVPNRVRLGDADDASFFDQDSTARLKLVVEQLPLALLLAIERPDFVVADWLWQTHLLPAQAGWGFAGPGSPRLFPRRTGAPLNSNEIAQLQEWSVRVADHYDPSIHVAVRRIRTAIRERVDAEDAVIDAVVAWENLFGHGGQTEVIFRVTTALAILLEQDVRRRSQLRSRLSKVYGVRSTVVHGGELQPRDDLQRRKELAIKTAVAALRRLFRDRPELIHDRQRGLRLILGE